MGARNAAALAHYFPEMVSGLFLVDLGLEGLAGGGLGDNLYSFLKILPKEFKTRTEAREFMAARCPDPAIAQYLLAVSQLRDLKNREGAVYFPFDHEALLMTLEQARQTDLKVWIRSFARQGKPVYILRGAQSTVFSKESYQDGKAALGDLASVQFIEVEGAGHGLPFEKRPWLIDYLRNQIQS